MSTVGETLEQAQQYSGAAAVSETVRALAVSESRLVLTSSECHVLIVLVWNPASLHLFADGLRPEVLVLAQAIRVVVTNEEENWDCFSPEELAMARRFIAEVDAAWPQMAKVRR